MCSTYSRVSEQLVAIEVYNENVYPIAYHVRNHVIEGRGECCSGSGVSRLVVCPPRLRCT